MIIGSRSGGVVEALHRAADSTEELDAMWDRWNTTRRGGARRLLDHPPLKADVRPTLDIEAAADVLTMLNNPELHYVYVTKGHWEEPTFEAWLADAMHRLILTPAGP